MRGIGKVAIGLSLVAVMGLTSCTKMVEGVVVSKEYDDPDQWTSTQCGAYNGKGVCTVWVPVQHYDGPHWYLELDGMNDKGERDRGKVEVGADEYGIFGVGAIYPGRPGEPVEYER